MKMLRLSVFLLAALSAVLAPAPARAVVEVSFDFFHDSLAPRGEWVEVGDYGPCWRPNDVDPNWAPYTDGYWAYTDAGWTWVSYEEYGGIVYHYGRWMRVEGAGWCWVPGYEWAPAWVSWRSSDDYVGWAPLPPWARWRRDVGISVWADREYDLGPGYYSFCRVHDFGAPVLRAVIIEPGRNVTIIAGTTNITNITFNASAGGGPAIFNGGPSFEVINRLSARPVPALKLVQAPISDPAALHQRSAVGGSLLAAQTTGNQLIMAAPLAVAPADPAALNVKGMRVIAAEKVSKGWNAVSPDAQRTLRQQIQQQAKGLTPATAPAHAIAAAELKSVPSKADASAKSGFTPSGEKHEKSANVPPAPVTATGAALKPFNAPNEGESKPKSPAITAEPKGLPPAGISRQQEEEQARARAEQGRMLQERPAPKPQVEDVRRHAEEAEPLRGSPTRGTAPATPPRPGAKNSKDSKDKDKDKNGN